MTRAAKITLRLYERRHPLTFPAWNEVPAVSHDTRPTMADVYALCRDFYSSYMGSADDVLCPTPYQDVNPSESSVFVFGNAGLPCA